MVVPCACYVGRSLTRRDHKGKVMISEIKYGVHVISNLNQLMGEKMKRDFDLIRLLLLELEGEVSVDLSSYNQDQVNYHKALIKEAGFVEGIIHYRSGITDIPDCVILKRLTWEGHEFLDKAKNDKVWNKAKSIIKEKGVSLSLDALKIAISEAVKMLLS